MRVAPLDRGSWLLGGAAGCKCVPPLCCLRIRWPSPMRLWNVPPATEIRGPTAGLRSILTVFVLSAFLALSGVASALERGHFHPAWSPDGEAIVYSGDDDGDFELYLLRWRTGEALQLTRNQVLDSTPSFTPDGSEIVFASDLGADRDIYSVSVDGGPARRVLALPGGQSRPQFVAETVLSFNHGVGSENRTIAVYDLGRGILKILVDGPAHDEWASWSPQADKILISSDRLGHWEVFEVNGDGSAPRRVTESPANSVSNAPRHSPDGRTFVYQSDKSGDFEIYLHDLDTGREWNLSQSPNSNDALPSFSPDGEWIAFESTRVGVRRIFVVRRDGSELVQVSR